MRAVLLGPVAALALTLAAAGGLVIAAEEVVGSSNTLDAATPVLYVDCGSGGVATHGINNRSQGGTMRSSELQLRYMGGGAVMASCRQLDQHNMPIIGELLDSSAPATTLLTLPATEGTPSDSQRVFAASLQLMPIATPNDVDLVFHWDANDLANQGITDPSMLRMFYAEQGADSPEDVKANPATQRFILLPTTVDAENRTLTASNLDISRWAAKHHLVMVFALGFPHREGSGTAGG
jgi:hypothetical protein